jgi:hypothetical protein
MQSSVLDAFHGMVASENEKKKDFAIQSFEFAHQKRMITIIYIQSILFPHQTTMRQMYIV